MHVLGVTAGNSRACRAETASDTHTNDFAATVDPSLLKRDRRLGVSGGCVTGGPYASHPALQAPLQYRGAP